MAIPPLPQVWSFNPIMQTKATIMSKSPLLSLEWAPKPDRLVCTTGINKLLWSGMNLLKCRNPARLLTDCY